MRLSILRQGPLPHSVLGRLIVLALASLFLVDITFFFPMMIHNRGWWLDQRRVEARALTELLDGKKIPLPPATVTWLRRVPGIQQLRVLGPGPPHNLLPAIALPPHLPRIPLARQFFWQAIPQALNELRHRHPGPAVLTFSALGRNIAVTVDRTNLHRHVLQYVHRYLVYIVILDLIVLPILFRGLRGLIVRPLERIADSVSEFSADPRSGPLIDPGRISPAQDDEIVRLAQRLAEMQSELQQTLWRDARLAALGTAVAKMNHDLRGILAPALLAADTLTTLPNPKAHAAATTVIRAVDRATDLARRILGFLHEAPPPPARILLHPRVVADDAASRLSADTPHPLAIVNDIDPALTCLANSESLLRVLLNLMRNAAQAGATTLTLSVEPASDSTILRVADNGPGLPPSLLPRLFHPFVPSTTGSGLGLAIARDLMRALGGDLVLEKTDATGTVFRLIL